MVKTNGYIWDAWYDRALVEGKPPISTSLSPDETTALQEFAKDGLVLEIGSAFGYSAVAMAQTAKHILAVDPHEEECHNSLATMRSNLEAYDVKDKVTIMIAFSQNIMPVLPSRKFDLVWIDGCHFEEAVSHDVNQAMRLVKKGGVIAAHDYHPGRICPGVIAALDKVAEPTEVIDSLWVYQA